MPEHLVGGVTQRLADFSLALRYEELQPEVIAGARKGILDFLGVALIGSRQASTRMLLKAAANSNKGGTATVLGSGTLTNPTVAALVNGYAAHALDYDDVQPVVGGHMSGSVLAVATVLAEMLHRSGKDLLTAYVTGFEVGCRIGRTARFGFFLRQHGVHPTGFLCHFGAAAAGGKLMGLNALQMKRNFGIAAGHASGIMRSFGTMCKGQNAGNAAQNALLSTLLAEQGFTAPEEIFDGEKNIFSIYGARTDPEELVQQLGQRFEITNNTFKIFACAGWRNPIIEALILLATAHDLQPADVKEINVQVCSEVIGLPNYREPQTGLEAKFSVEHAAAAALTDRAGGVEQFTDERAADPGMAELRRKVTLEAGEGLALNQVRVFVRTRDGRALSQFIGASKGDPRNPVSWDELVEKFRANALAVLPRGQVEKLAAMIRDLDAVEDVAELMRVCRPANRT